MLLMKTCRVCSIAVALLSAVTLSAQPPAGGTPAPSGGTQAPSGGGQAPSGGGQAPSGGGQAPSGGGQAPAGGAQPPSGGAQAPSAGGQTPATGEAANPGGLTAAQLRLLPKAVNAPDIPFKVVPDFMKLHPNVYLGEGIGVATNSKGHIFVNTCAQQTRVFEFDPKGNYVREIGKDLYGFVFCHGVRVDAEDNIWAIDEGSNMIIKFNPQGRVTMVLGRRIGFPYNGLEPPLKELNPAPN